MTPMEALGMLGYALDTPGALTRGVLSGRPGERASGRDMLESWGILDQNQEGLDAGDVAGFAADMVVDPLNLIGIGAVTKAAKGAKTAKAFNTKAAKLLETGGMPEDVAKLTKAVDEAGNPLRLYHGTANAFDKYDLEKMDPSAMYGRGVYMTVDPHTASAYADPNSIVKAFPESGASPNVRVQFLDSRKPFDMNATYPAEEVNRIAAAAGDKGWKETSYPMLGDEVFGSRGGGVVGSPTRVAANAGYDAITHTGGQMTGGKLHDVWIAPDPAQLYSPWIAPNPVPVPSIAKPLAAVAAVNAVKQLSPPKPPRTLSDYQRLTNLAARSTR